MGGGFLLSAWDCAELSYSQSFLFPTSWVALEPHLCARRGRKTIVGEGRDFVLSGVTSLVDSKLD